MLARRSRAGIERKILTSILWVGVLPMVLVLFVGYFMARTGQSNAVQQALLTAAEKTGESVHVQMQARLDGVAKIARHAYVIAFLEQRDVPTHDGLNTVMQAGQLLSPGDAPAVLNLYDMDGDLLFSTEEGASLAMPNSIPRDLDRPTFAQFRLRPEQTVSVVAAAPVVAQQTGQRVGFLTVESAIDRVIEYALGRSPFEEREPTTSDIYQLAFLNDSGFNLVIDIGDLDFSSLSTSNPPLMEPRLREILASKPMRGSVLLRDYVPKSGAQPNDVLLAYSRMGDLGFPEQSIYFVVYRPAAAVFGNINLLSLLALGACMAFIFFLCINAYRDVHNNIVRPISLLNEGAQIIRQGDFDLKLKIGTGDEIEELAMSFNKMAQALSRNLHQLEASEEKHRTLVTSMRDGIYQTDGDGAITFLNPAAVEILGFRNVEQAIGTRLSDLFIDEKEEEQFRSDPVLDDQESRYRVWMRRRDGKTVCVEMTRNRLYDSEREAVGIEGTLRDVTKSVQLEKESRERSDRIAAINQIANVINSSLEAGRLYESLVGELQKLVEFDYASVALLGEDGRSFDGRQLYPEEQMGPGHTFVLRSPESYAARVAERRSCLLVRDLAEADSAFADEFPRSIRSCLCVPLFATGRIIGTLNLGSRMVGQFTESHVETLEQMAPHLAVAIRNAQLLTNLQLSLEEVTRAREKLHEANEELKTLDELKTNLLSNVSHELRTPLVSVMGYTDMILSAKAGPINKTQQEYLEISLRNVEKLVTLIENLLDFSRLHRGDEQLIFDTFDLVDCARSSIEMVQPIADSRQIMVELHAVSEPLLVEGDKAKLGQVFTNLLSNAVKFNTNGGRVELTLTPLQDRVEVIVKDTGIGIPPDALDKVFTRFYQYDASSTRKYGGTGIGLSIAQDIVRLHGGTISVSSEGRGMGSVFRFELPLANVSAGVGGAGLPNAEETHILVELISTDRSLSNEVRDVLAAENIDVIHAGTTERAFALIQRYSPDCILVDLNTSEESLKRLLLDASLSSHPLILLTNDEERALEYRDRVAARTKRNFRKSSLLSSIHQAMSGGLTPARPIGERVLCVDDDDEIGRFVQHCLESEGYAVDTCGSGQEALDLADSGAYGLVLMDVAMPGMDGFEACLRLKSNPELSGIKVYLVTAKPVDRNLNKVHECGADGFLLKPFHAEDLLHLVRGLDLRAVAK
jgi:PAS domain S-box-containing protein